MKIEIHINDRLVSFVRRLCDRRALTALAAVAVVTGASIAVAITQAPPNTFSAGATISSSQVNQHFQQLYQAVWTLEQNQGLAAGSVQTTHLANNAVTAAKLANGSVERDKLENGAVTNDKLGNGAVNHIKLSSSAVTTDKLSTGAVTGDKLALNAVTRDKIEGTELAVWQRPTGCRSLDRLLISSSAPPSCPSDPCGGGTWYSCTSASSGSCTQGRPICSWTKVGYLLAP